MWIRIPNPDPDPEYKINDKMKGKAEFNQQKYFFFRRKLYFLSLNLKKEGSEQLENKKLF